jgi:protein-disulfide isomerase
MKQLSLFKSTFGLAALAAFVTIAFASTPILAQTRTELPKTDWSKTVSAPKVANGISFGELVIGNPDAKVEVIEYASMTCGACSAFHELYFPQLMVKYISTGKIKFIFRNQIRDAADLYAAKAAHCSSPYNSLLLTGELFLRQKEWVNSNYRESIVNIIEGAGIKREKVESCIDNPELQTAILGMMEEGIRRGVNSTPTLFLNGKPLDRMFTHNDLENAIEMALTMQK